MRKIWKYILAKLKLEDKAALAFKDSVKQAQNQSELDKKLVYSLSKSRIPNFKQLKYLGRYLSKREVWLIRSSILIIIISLLFSGARFYLSHLEQVPVQSGEYVEAVIGTPKHINPLYQVINDADNDLGRLIYSSLFKRDANAGLEKDLVEQYSVSEDFKEYIFKIRPDVVWHDGTQLSANDVIFTFGLIKDRQYQSPLRASFNGVEIEKISDLEFKFILTSPYAAFLDLLTFGILPSDIWAGFGPEAILITDLNIKPIGSGPYRYDEIVREKKSGIIKEYRLAINEDYYAQQPYLRVTFKFFDDYLAAIDALNNNIVDGINYLPLAYKDQLATPKALNINRLYTPQITSLFVNQEKNNKLRDKAVRQALAYAINKNEIVNTVLGGSAYVIDGPILQNSFAYNSEIRKYEYNLEEAGRMLDNIDWKIASVSQEMAELSTSTQAADLSPEQVVGPGNWRKKNNEYLVVNLTTVDREENLQVINSIKEFWEAIGVKTILSAVPAAQIQTQVIGPRNFEVMFYGQVLNPDPDPYVFWHSSQAGEGGYNIANYFNKDVDSLLEEARQSTDENLRREKYSEFQKIVAEELPAIFLYATIYNYPQSNEIKGFATANIYSPSDRFNNIEDWYKKIGKKLVW